MKIYLDTMILIYIVEDVETYSEKFSSRYNLKENTFVTSELTRLECRVKPIKQNALELLQDFDLYFEESLQEIIPISREVIDLATHIRANFGFKTPDSIHLASAKINQCDIFLTFDDRLKNYKDIKVEMLE